MNYEVKNIQLVNAPVDNPDGTSRTWFMNVYTGVVGQTYDGFTNIDGTSFVFLKTDSQTVVLDKRNATAVAFSTAKYPNT